MDMEVDSHTTGRLPPVAVTAFPNVAVEELETRLAVGLDRGGVGHRGRFRHCHLTAGLIAAGEQVPDHEDDHDHHRDHQHPDDAAAPLGLPRRSSLSFQARLAVLLLAGSLLAPHTRTSLGGC